MSPENPIPVEAPVRDIKYESYQNPLVERNASPEMIKLWSPQKKFSTWRRLWVALAEAERETGLTRISQEAIDQMKANVDTIDFKRAELLEKENQHDVMAHIETFEEAAPAAKGIIHLGATSMDINDNSDLLIMRDAMELVIKRLASLIDALAQFAEQHKDHPTLGYTHLQPAQPTTVGKRAAMWCQDFLIAFDELEHRLHVLKLRGLKGATGTQDSFLKLFDGDPVKVRELEKLFVQKMGGSDVFPVTGQVYPRMLDTQIVSALALVAQAAHKMCNDIRMLAHDKEMEEPAGLKQVGSTAMAYKVNPMRAERTTGISRVLEHSPGIAAQVASEQFFERTLDDSATRRIILPEAFLACDSDLLILTNITRGLKLYPKVIERRLREELPLMATETILMAAVKAGGDRQQLHEAIREHSREAAKQVKELALPNDLTERLKQDPLFATVDIDATLDPTKHIGLAPEQVTAFIRDHIEPIRKQYRQFLGMKAELKV